MSVGLSPTKGLFSACASPFSSAAAFTGGAGLLLELDRTEALGNRSASCHTARRETKIMTAAIAVFRTIMLGVELKRIRERGTSRGGRDLG